MKGDGQSQYAVDRGIWVHHHPLSLHIATLITEVISWKHGSPLVTIDNVIHWLRV